MPRLCQSAVRRGGCERLTWRVASWCTAYVRDRQRPLRWVRGGGRRTHLGLWGVPCQPACLMRRFGASRSPSPASTPASTSSVVTECSSSSPAPVIWPRQNADRLSVAFRWPSGARRTWSVSKTWAVRARAAVVCRMDRASRASDPRRRNQPLNEPIGELGQRASRRDPAVVASAHVPGRGSDDVPTVAPDVDAIAELSGRVSDLGTRVGEPSVFTARTGSDLPSAKGTVSRLQIGERITTSVRRVDIDHHKTRLATSPDSHVRRGPLTPPPPDDSPIRRCVR